MISIDPNLISRARRGDHPAVHELVQELRPHVFGIAVSALSNLEDAQDVTQNALIAILLQLPDLRESEALASFARLVTLHQCVDFRRRRATRRVPGPSWDEFEVAAEEVEVEERMALRDALSRLPDPEREVLLLDYAAGLRHEEIASRIGVSAPSVRRRLLAAKRRLRSDLGSLQTPNMQLESPIQELIDQAFPNAIVSSTQPDPEAWLPYRLRLDLTSKGKASSADVREDVDDQMARLLPELTAGGIPAPALLAGPSQVLGAWRSLWRTPTGRNLTEWAMDGTYHRFRTATDLVLEMIDRIQAFTPRAMALGVQQVSLSDRFDELQSYRGPWEGQSIFREGVETLSKLVPGSERPLLYGHYLQFFPNWYRVEGADASDGEAMLPPFPTRSSVRVSEVVYPFGQLSDPLLGLAMVWIYDCYPFVHTGFVEQYLVRHNVARREFAIRLALQTLATMVGELPVEKLGTEDGYARSLTGLVELGLGWL